MRRKLGFYNLNIMDKMNDCRKPRYLKGAFNLNCSARKKQRIAVVTIPQVHPGAVFWVVDLDIHIGKKCCMSIELRISTPSKSLPPPKMTNQTAFF